MQIQLNTDNHTEGSVELKLQVESTLESELSRFGDRITRVEVHLSDQNSLQKSDDSDKRCVLEARLSGMQPVKVSADGSTLEQAINVAAKNLSKFLSRQLDRLDNPKGRTSFAGEPTE